MNQGLKFVYILKLKMPYLTIMTRNLHSKGQFYRIYRWMAIIYVHFLCSCIHLHLQRINNASPSKQTVIISQIHSTKRKDDLYSRSPYLLAIGKLDIDSLLKLLLWKCFLLVVGYSSMLLADLCTFDYQAVLESYIIIQILIVKNIVYS